MLNKTVHGLKAEQTACNYLNSHGLVWLESNYRSRMGEIDLIMRDRQVLVFVEVRARTSNAYGGGMTSITHSKKQKIMKTAQLYLSVKKLHNKQPIRFDVVSLDGRESSVTWIQDAFGADY